MTDFVPAPGSAAGHALARAKAQAAAGGSLSEAAAAIRARVAAVTDAGSVGMAASVPPPFTPIIPPPTHHHGFSVGDSTELGDNARTVVDKINAGFKALFEHISGAASAAPALIPSAAPPDLSHLVTKAEAVTKEDIAEVNAKIDAHSGILTGIKADFADLEDLVNRAVNAFLDREAAASAPGDPNAPPPPNPPVT